MTFIRVLAVLALCLVASAISAGATEIVSASLHRRSTIDITDSPLARASNHSQENVSITIQVGFIHEIASLRSEDRQGGINFARLYADGAAAHILFRDVKYTEITPFVEFEIEGRDLLNHTAVTFVLLNRTDGAILANFTASVRPYLFFKQLFIYLFICIYVDVKSIYLCLHQCCFPGG
jgi:hypothetical protein